MFDNPMYSSYFQIIHDSTKVPAPPYAYYNANRLQGIYNETKLYLEPPDGSDKFEQEQYDKVKDKLIAKFEKPDSKWQEVAKTQKELFKLMDEHAAIIKYEGPREKNDLLFYYKQNVEAALWPSFIRGHASLINSNNVVMDDSDPMHPKQLTLDDLQNVRGYKNADFSKIHVSEDQGKTRVSEGIYPYAYKHALEDLIKIEKLRDKVIVAAKATAEYAGLPEDKKQKFLSEQLLRTYVAGGDNERARKAVKKLYGEEMTVVPWDIILYFPTQDTGAAFRMSELQEVLDELEKKKGLPQQKVPAPGNPSGEEKSQSSAAPDLREILKTAISKVTDRYGEPSVKTKPVVSGPLETPAIASLSRNTQREA